MKLPSRLIDDKSTLGHVMACCLRATSHYLSQCWPRSMSPHCVSRPQWIQIQPSCSLSLDDLMASLMDEGRSYFKLNYANSAKRMPYSDNPWAVCLTFARDRKLAQSSQFGVKPLLGPMLTTDSLGTNFNFNSTWTKWITILPRNCIRKWHPQNVCHFLFRSHLVN